MIEKSILDEVLPIPDMDTLRDIVKPLEKE